MLVGRSTNDRDLLPTGLHNCHRKSGPEDQARARALASPGDPRRHDFDPGRPDAVYVLLRVRSAALLLATPVRARDRCHQRAVLLPDPTEPGRTGSRDHPATVREPNFNTFTSPQTNQQNLQQTDHPEQQAILLLVEELLQVASPPQAQQRQHQ